MLLVTGPVSKNMEVALKRTYDATPEPKLVVAIGKGGAMLKKIGAGARKSIEEDTGARVFLELWVKVRDSWRHDETWVDRLVGLE